MGSIQKNILRKRILTHCKALERYNPMTAELAMKEAAVCLVKELGECLKKENNFLSYQIDWVKSLSEEDKAQLEKCGNTVMKETKAAIKFLETMHNNLSGICSDRLKLISSLRKLHTFIRNN